MNSSRHIIVFCLCLLACVARAQDIPHFFEKLTTDEGLSSNRINDIEQDDKGFLWIATTDGLNRFDGTEVIQYFHQNKANSIPNNYVYCIKKLPDGKLAIGTQAGLCFYNSNTGQFENFYYKTNDSLEKYSNTIILLETDDNGNLWAGSRNCIFIFDSSLKLKKLISSPFTEADAEKDRIRFVQKVFPLANGNMLLYLYNGWHIYSTQTDTITIAAGSPLVKQLPFLNIIDNPPPVPKFTAYFPLAHVFQVFRNYFICIKPNADSLLLFDRAGRQVSACAFPYNKYPYILWSQQVAVIDSTKLLFLFHNYGFAIIPVSWQNNQPVIHDPSSLVEEKFEYDNAIRDQQGNWWLATTEQGLQKVSPSKQYFNGDILTDPHTGKQINYDVNYVARYNNKLWISTYGEGFFEKDLASGKQQQHLLMKTDDDTWSNFIWNIRQVSDDTLWLGTQIGMLWYSIAAHTHGHIPNYPGKPAVLDSVAITTQFADSHGMVWIGLGKGKGVCYFDTKQRRFVYYPGNGIPGYPLRYATVIMEDKKEDLWFVSDASTTLIHWIRNSDRFETIPLGSQTKNQISDLTALWCGSDNTIWLGTITSGLIKYQPATGAISVYGHDMGLKNSFISGIYEDNKKRLWLVTAGALSWFDTNTNSFTNYTSKDGVPVRFPTGHFYYDSLQQNLYAGGQGAYFYFNPDKIGHGALPRKAMITAVQVNGKPYMLLPGQTAAFRSWENDITIQYSAVDLINGPETKYAYKLIGEDTGWIVVGNQRQINFSRLAPGNYTFLVRASTADAVWSQEAAILSFSIRRPFTKTAWFYGLIIAAIAAVFYGLYRFRLRQLMKTEQIRNEISKNLHDEVGSTLTNISLGSLLAQKKMQPDGFVKHILDRIYQDSQNVSESMREIVWSINPKIDTLGESLPRMLRYASELLEAKDIELQADIAPGIEHIKLSMQERRDIYLIFKESLTNLAKYSTASHASINFHVDGKTLVMLISDNGIGFDAATGSMGNGLKNMRERAESHRWQLSIQSARGTGTTLLLKAQIA